MKGEELARGWKAQPAGREGIFSLCPRHSLLFSFHFSFFPISLSTLSLPSPVSPTHAHLSAAFALFVVPIGIHCTPNENLSIAVLCRRI